MGLALQQHFDIARGMLEVPKKPGLGIEIGPARLAYAHERYKPHDLGTRGDTQAMQYVIRGWKFDNKRPYMGR